MRSRIAGAILIGAASVAAANAADISAGFNVSGSNGVYSSYVARMEPVIVFDFEPGVIVRSYWYPPWRNRHYFPRTGKRPRIGRREILPKHGMSKPEEYFRFWSASSFPSDSSGRYAVPTESGSEQQ
jgi:hypothetical protein